MTGMTGLTAMTGLQSGGQVFDPKAANNQELVKVVESDEDSQENYIKGECEGLDIKKMQTQIQHLHIEQELMAFDVKLKKKLVRILEQKGR